MRVLDRGHVDIGLFILFTLIKQAVQQLCDLHFVGVADHGVHTVQRGTLGIGLRKATRDHDKRLGILCAHATDELACLAVGFSRDGAGIDDIGVTARLGRANGVATCQKCLLDGAGFILVYLTALRQYADCSFYFGHVILLSILSRCLF